METLTAAVYIFFCSGKLEGKCIEGVAGLPESDCHCCAGGL